MASLALNALPYLLRRQAEGIECTEISDICPVEESIYGYYPSLPWNSLFLAFFALSTIGHLIQGIHYKTWSFMVFVVIGGACETVGQAGRLMLNDNPFSEAGFNLQIVLLTFAPAFLAAGVYLNLKHLVITFGASFSRLRPNLYTWIFIACDIFSIALQGAGGGISASAEPSDSIWPVGNNLMIAGLAFQVATLVLFGLLAGEYAFRVFKHKHELNPATESLRRSMKFKLFLGAIFVAYITILIRCVYRVVEMAGGWSRDNHIMREETLFLALDSFMISVAMLVFNAFHPGACLKYKKQADAEKMESAAQSDYDNGMMESK